MALLRSNAASVFSHQGRQSGEYTYPLAKSKNQRQVLMQHWVDCSVDHVAGRPEEKVELKRCNRIY